MTQKYYEVEVTFENPTWTTKGKAKTREKMLMTPDVYEDEKKLIKNTDPKHEAK